MVHAIAVSLPETNEANKLNHELLAWKALGFSQAILILIAEIKAFLNFITAFDNLRMLCYHKLILKKSLLHF